MSNVSIYGKKWIDLVFEDRNQVYGAYQLRQQNPRVTLLALFWGVLLMGGFLSIAVFSNFKSHDDVIIEPVDDGPSIHVTPYTAIDNEPKVEKEKITPPNTTVDPVEPVINIFSTLTVTATQNAQDVPTNEEMKNIETPSIQGTTTTIGIGTEPENNTGKTNGSLIDTGSGNIPNGKEISKPNEVDKLPSYPGGINNFYQYVANNFKNPDLETGSTVSVLVAFVVERDGTLSNIRVIRNSGYGTDKEAIRVLSALKTKWNPGIKDGQKVRTEFTLPIKVKFD